MGIGRDRMKKVYLQSGYYENRSVLAAALNRELSDVSEGFSVKFSFNETTGRFSLTVNSTGFYVFGMSNDLQHYLSFELNSVAIDMKAFSTTAEQTFDANRGLNLMYV